MTPKELENLKEAYNSIRKGVEDAVNHVKENGDGGATYLTALQEVLQMFNFHDKELGMTEEDKAFKKTYAVRDETYEEVRDRIINKYSQD